MTHKVYTIKPSIVGTGLIALDVVVDIDRKNRSRLYAGGTCGNVLTILSYLGWKSYPIARMGKDAAAATVLRDMHRWEVNTDFISLPPTADTPIVVERLKRQPSGEVRHRFSWTCPNCGAWLPGYKAVPGASIAEVVPQLQVPTVFFFDRVSRGAIELAKVCNIQGSVVMFEPSGQSDPTLFSEVLEYVHILKYSNERMNELSGLQSALAPLLLIETMGAEGLRYRSNLPSVHAKGWQICRAPKLTIIRDTAGAGDWCSAGILHSLASGGLAALQSATAEQIAKAIDIGQAMAAWTCQYESARGGMYQLKRRELDKTMQGILRGGGAQFTKEGRSKRTTNLKCIAPSCVDRLRKAAVKNATKVAA